MKVELEEIQRPPALSPAEFTCNGNHMVMYQIIAKVKKISIKREEMYF